MRKSSRSSLGNDAAPALADTGIVYALLDRSDAWHERARVGWERRADAIAVPAPVIVEVCQLLAYRIGPHAEREFLTSVARGDFPAQPLDAEDYVRAGELVGIYADLPLGFVDAAVVALAERLDVETVLTTDRRHFSVVRPRHMERLRLEP